MNEHDLKRHSAASGASKRRGPAPGTGGRPQGPPKQRLCVRVLPDTREWLGKDPSAALDRLCQENKLIDGRKYCGTDVLREKPEPTNQPTT